MKSPSRCLLCAIASDLCQRRRRGRSVGREAALREGRAAKQRGHRAHYRPLVPAGEIERGRPLQGVDVTFSNKSCAAYGINADVSLQRLDPGHACDWFSSGDDSAGSLAEVLPFRLCGVPPSVNAPSSVCKSPIMLLIQSQLGRCQIVSHTLTCLLRSGAPAPSSARHGPAPQRWRPARTRTPSPPALRRPTRVPAAGC